MTRMCLPVRHVKTSKKRCKTLFLYDARIHPIDVQHTRRPCWFFALRARMTDTSSVVTNYDRDDALQ